MGLKVLNRRIVAQWRGQKNLGAAARILSLLPPDLPLLDLFGGSGIITLNSPAPHRWWNDSDPALHRLAWAIRGDADRLRVACSGLPFVEDTWERWRNTPRESWPPEIVAFGAVVTFSGRMGGRAHLSDANSREWSEWCRRIPEVSALLQGVRMTCLDWRAALNWAGTRWAVYADPPYEGAHDREYSTGEPVPYRELCSALSACAALNRRSVVVSGYSGADVPGGWVSHVEPDGPQRKVRQRIAGEVFQREAHWRSP